MQDAAETARPDDPSVPVAQRFLSAQGAYAGHQVFISYAHEDFEICTRVCAALERSAVLCWMAPRDLTPGADWSGAIVDAIRGGKVFVAIFSAKSNASQQVLREINCAVDRRIPIILVRLEDVQLSTNLQYYLSVCHWLDCTSGTVDAALPDLVLAVQSHLHDPESAPRVASAGRSRPSHRAAYGIAGTLLCLLAALAAAAYGPRFRKSVPAVPPPTLTSQSDSWVARAVREDEHALWNAERLPSEVTAARGSFEAAWQQASMDERRRADQAKVCEALCLVTRFLRIQEKFDDTKPLSRQSAQRAIEYFQQDVPNPRHAAECLLEKAAILVDLASAENSDPLAAVEFAKRGRDTVQQAASMAGDELLPEALRLKSTFCYLLARPPRANPALAWDNALLEEAFAAAKDAYHRRAAWEEGFQFTLVWQRLAANPPHQDEPQWTAPTRRTLDEFRRLWAENDGKLKDPISRIPALSLMSALTADTICREWSGLASDEDRRTSATAFLRELDEFGVKPASEAINDVAPTPWRKPYAFDLAYNLGCVHAVRCQMLQAVNAASADAEFNGALVPAMQAARRAATADQARGAVQDIDVYPALKGLTGIRKESLEALFKS